MVKPLTTIIYPIVSLFLILILLSPSSDSPPVHRRLKIQTTFPVPSSSNDHLHRHRHPELVLFDPLVADIERLREDREWERRYLEHAHPEILKHLHEKDAEPPAHGHVPQPEKVDVMDAEEFLNDEEKFNVTNRLVLLFPKIDVDPVDGFVSSKELIAWNLNQSQHNNMHRTRREMEIHDRDQDGFISFYEYEPPSWVQGSEHSFGFDVGWWKEEHFNSSDADGDGLLNVTEFNNFLHPADSKNPRLMQWLCKEELRERDTNRDGKINFSEFFHGIFDLVRNYEDVSHKSPRESADETNTSARFMFAQLDKDGDGYLSDLELMPTIDKLHPSEYYYAKQQSEYITSQADTNKDGRLSLAEMIDNPYVFYNAIFSEEEDNGFDLHDEFR